MEQTEKHSDHNRDRVQPTHAATDTANSRAADPNDAMDGSSNISRRQLLRAGWTVPVVAALALPDTASATGGGKHASPGKSRKKRGHNPFFDDKDDEHGWEKDEDDHNWRDDEEDDEDEDDDEDEKRSYDWNKWRDFLDGLFGE